MSSTLTTGDGTRSGGKGQGADGARQALEAGDAHAFVHGYSQTVCTQPPVQSSPVQNSPAQSS